MIQRFQNSSLLAESLDVQPRLFVSHGPFKGEAEQFPGGAAVPPRPALVGAGPPAPAPARKSKSRGGRDRGGRDRRRGGAAAPL